jgi:hypothetical protein
MAEGGHILLHIHWQLRILGGLGHAAGSIPQGGQGAGQALSQPVGTKEVEEKAGEIEREEPR